MSHFSEYQVHQKLHGSERTLVFRGSRLADNQPVIIKMPGSRGNNIIRNKRLRREYQLGSGFDSPYIVSYLDITTLPGGTALIMEDFGGDTLRGHIPRSGLSVPAFLELAVAMARGLAHIHRAGVIHRDIKADNLVFNAEKGMVKYIDFGISSQLEQEYQEHVCPNRLEGTITYISPEQTGRMNRPVDYRTDFYSLGVTFYEMLAGVPPFQARDALEVIHCHLARKPMPLSERRETVPLVLSDIVVKLLEKSADERYQSAEGLLADLDLCRQRLREQGSIPVFPLGSKDYSDRFSIPRKLYGRAQELNILMASFDRVASGKRELLLVTGPAGVGKSVLVHELDRPVTGRKGFFIHGKFDEMARDVAYSAITSAFRELIRQLLGEDDEVVRAWRQKLRAVLGTNAAVVAEIIPDLELILGKCAPPPKLDPAETRNRFRLAISDFISCFAKPEHPLVLFLDDLQWADGASIELVRGLLDSPAIDAFLLIGSCRDLERGAEILRMQLQAMEHEGKQVPRLKLEPLDLFQVTELVAETLHASHKQVSELARLVLTKTHGNPFFIFELLGGLHRQGLIRFDLESHQWSWKAEEIESADISHNMAQLVALRLHTLPEETRDLLCLAAVIGNSFELILLAAVKGMSEHGAALALRPALEQGLVIPLRNDYRLLEVADDDEKESGGERIIYRFQHDRVRQAAYNLTGKVERPALHLAIGRCLLQSWSRETEPEKITDIVHHFNESRHLLTDADEQLQLAELNLEAGHRALDAVAYVTARDYLQAGINCLPDDPWSSHYELAYHLHLHHAESCYLSHSDDELARANWQTLLREARGMLDMAKPRELQMVFYLSNQDADLALAKGLEGLDILNHHLPPKPALPQLLLEGYRLHRRLRSLDLDNLVNQQEISDPKVKMVMDMLMRLSLAAFFTGRRRLYAMVAMRRVWLTLSHGISPESANAFVSFGVFLSVMRRYGLALKFGKLALDLDDRFRYLPLRAKVLFVYGFNIHPWHHHWKSINGYLKKAAEVGMQSGDYLYSSLACAMIGHWDPTLDLETANKESLHYHSLVRNARSKFSGTTILLRYRMSLQGLTKHPMSLSGDDYDEGELREHLAARNLASANALYYLVKLQQAYLYGAIEIAMDHLQKIKDNERAIASTPLQVELCFYGFLTRVAWFRNKHTPKLQQRLVLRRKLDAMKRWEQLCPVNFSHRRLLMEAELAGLQGHSWRAVSLYRKAVDQARENDYPSHRALAAECAGHFLMRNGHQQMAASFLQEADACYQNWGAFAMVARLRQTYPDVMLVKPLAGKSSKDSTTISLSLSLSLSQSTTSSEPAPMDLDSVIREATALSSLVDYDQLLQQLVSTAITRSGARSGSLTYNRNGRLMVEAIGDTHGVTVTGGRPLDACDRLSQRLVRATFSNGEVIVLDDAADTDQFNGDPYIIARRIRSIACLPIRYQDQITGVLYLEHPHQRGVFSDGDIDWLMLYAGQAAIALENTQLFTEAREARQKVLALHSQLAQLNEELEERVKKRTAQVEEVQQELLEQAHQTGMSDIASAVLSNVSAILNSVNTSCQVLQETIAGSRMPGLLKANELLRENMDHIDDFIRQDPKGKDLLRYYLGLDAPYQREKKVVEENVVRLIEKVEAIRAVIMAQQSYAKGNQRAEPIDLQAIADDALRILSGELAQAHVEVIKAYASIPKLMLSRSRLMHLFVNIIKNALEAMAGRPDPRCLTIRTESLDGEVIASFEDTGEGMAQDSLEQIFGHGYTTKEGARGYGLHTAANAISEMGGHIKAHSDGPGKGAAFVLTFPITI